MQGALSWVDKVSVATPYALRQNGIPHKPPHSLSPLGIGAHNGIVGLTCTCQGGIWCRCLLPSLSFFSQASFHLGFFPVGVVGLPVADALGSRFGFLGMGLGSSGLRLGCSARGLCSGFGLGASKCETLSLHIAKFWRVQRCNFFRVGNRTCIVSNSHFRKLHLCTLVFLYLFFRRKITEIDRAVIPSRSGWTGTLSATISQIWARSPAPLPTLEKNKIMILCSICTLIFVSGGEGGCRACHMHLCQLRSPRGGRLDGFHFCLSFRRVYFWARKSQEKLDTQIRASPVQDSCYGCCLC